MSNILYAEDDRDCRELFAFRLRQNKHKVHEARNGAQAVQIVREEPIDLVVLDIRMPMMTGYDAARIIDQERPDLPVMFLSAKGMRDEVSTAYECGSVVVDYMVKPISPDEMVDRVERLIEECGIRGMEAIREENMSRELVVE